MSEQFVEVIVDVPSMQTNQPYTYAVPTELINQVFPGMRVIVPFGNRKILGFTTKIISKRPDVSFELKNIEEVLDLVPVLNREMLELANWLAKWTFSFKISCLQVMLPAAMRASYNKSIRLISTDVSDEVKALFGQKEELPFDSKTLAPESFKILSKLNRDKKAEVIYQVHDRARSKKVTAITNLLTSTEILSQKDALRTNAVKSAKLLDFLGNLGDKTMILKEAIQESGLSSAIFSQGEKKGWLKKVKVEKYRDPYRDTKIEKTEPKKLQPAQENAVTQIDQAVVEQKIRSFYYKELLVVGKQKFIYTRSPVL